MRLILIRPDDLHLHLRDEPALADLVPALARRFARGLVMPNLAAPVTTVAAAEAYRRRILAAVPEEQDFDPLMTLYLTAATPVEEIDRTRENGHIRALKLYPAGATTHSEHGVRRIEAVYPVLERMITAGLVLAVHGELADPALDPYEREPRFIDTLLAPLVERYPDLRIVFEHVSTREGIEFVQTAGPRIGATITAHHLLCSRRDLFSGGLSPHHFCRPLLQSETTRQALVAAATGESPRFFLGSDSAPHPRRRKECAHAAAGIYTGYGALELYAEVFAAANALDRLEDFASRRGAAFYGLPLNTGTVSLEQTTWTIPDEYPFAGETVVPFRAGESLHFRLVP